LYIMNERNSSYAATVTMKPFLRYGVSLKELDIAVV
jgi:hypothetical protein